jgi:hypothetical protein
MVDVSPKAETARTATARGRIVMAPETLALIREGRAGRARQQGKAGQGKRGAAGDGHGRNPWHEKECCPFCAAPGTPSC